MVLWVVQRFRERSGFNSQIICLYYREARLKSLPTRRWWPTFIKSVLVQIILTIFTISLCEAFDSFEHRYIADQASTEAFQRLHQQPSFPKGLKTDWENEISGLKSTAELQSKDSVYSAYIQNIPLTFGDLAALGGDHAATPEALEIILNLLKRAGDSEARDCLFDELLSYMPYPVHYTLETEKERIVATRRQWLAMCNWLSTRVSTIGFSSFAECPEKALATSDRSIRQALDSGMAVSTLMFPSEGYSPYRSELAEFERLAGYVSLASKNKSHFPRYSWQTYSINHNKAIHFAHCYYSAHGSDIDECGQNIDRRRHLRKAIIFEGFAQHFLQDSFSSGHIDAAYKRGKELLQHTHDTLNHTGVDVCIPKLPDFLWSDPVPFANNVRGVVTSTTGWSAFGDSNLFIPEAALHRLILIEMATQSISEVLLAATTATIKPECQMCTEKIFPFPTYRCREEGAPDSLFFKVDLLDKQYRATSLHSGTYNAAILPLSPEGWKLLVGYGWSKLPLNSPNATSMELGYLRSTERRIPNYLGVGFLLVPNLRASIYPLSFDYWIPRNIEPHARFAARCFGGIRLNLGIRMDEAFTPQNVSSKNSVGGEMNIVGDGGIQLFPPLAIFLRTELKTVNMYGSLGNPRWSKDGLGAITIGIRYDLAKIF